MESEASSDDASLDSGFSSISQDEDTDYSDNQEWNDTSDEDF